MNTLVSASTRSSASRAWVSRPRRRRPVRSAWSAAYHSAATRSRSEPRGSASATSRIPAIASPACGIVGGDEHAGAERVGAAPVAPPPAAGRRGRARCGPSRPRPARRRRGRARVPTHARWARDHAPEQRVTVVGEVEWQRHAAGALGVALGEDQQRVQRRGLDRQADGPGRPWPARPRTRRASPTSPRPPGVQRREPGQHVDRGTRGRSTSRNASRRRRAGVGQAGVERGTVPRRASRLAAVVARGALLAAPAPGTPAAARGTPPARRVGRRPQQQLRRPRGRPADRIRAGGWATTRGGARRRESISARAASRWRRSRSVRGRSSAIATSAIRPCANRAPASGSSMLWPSPLAHGALVRGRAGIEQARDQQRIARRAELADRYAGDRRHDVWRCTVADHGQRRHHTRGRAARAPPGAGGRRSGRSR